MKTFFTLGVFFTTCVLPLAALAQQQTAGDRNAGQAPALTPEARAELGVADANAGHHPDQDSAVHRTLVPPFLLLERSANRRTTVVFPFVFRDRRGDSTSLLVPPYYRHRSPRQRTDVVFPLFFSWRGALDRPGGGDYSTWVVPPVYSHRWTGRGQSHGSALGVAPLFFYGESWGDDGALRREHLVIPPLLTFHTWRPEHALTIAGPFFYDRLRGDTDWGVAPLFFAGNDPQGNYLLIPPLLTYHHENRETRTNLTVVGPFWTRGTPDGFSVNLAPLFFHHHDRNERSTTFFPFFHHYSDRETFTLVTPVFGYSRDRTSSTLITPLYQRHRGHTNWDAVAPFFYSSREPSTGAHTEAFFPLFYHHASPASSTWWILPTVHAHSEPGSSYFNIYPLLFTGREGPKRHSVFFPFVWDFANSETGTRATVVAPLFWRFASPESVTMLVGNFLWMSSVREGVRSYEWHLLPLFSYARPRPEDVSWSVLFGLAGYRRSGTHRQIRALWIPINID